MLALRVKQTMIILGAVLLAVGMVLLGRWQLDVYHEQGARASATRAAEAAIPLATVAPAGQAITDGYGRSVVFEGRYEPGLQLLLPLADSPGRSRVLTGFRLGDGSVVPVVRGVVDTGTAPPPPAALLTQTGVLLPSEDSTERGSAPPGESEPAAVRIPLLAQQWPGPLVSGFVTLAGPEADAQGLTPATLTLPEAPGRFRNGAYAVQWWLFAAFALVMAVRMARDLGRFDPGPEPGLLPEPEPVPEITAQPSPDRT